MRVRSIQGHADEKIELQMTPMIDIVFQLLIFFIFTFKITSPEGDFNVRMPLAAPSAGIPDPNQLPPIKVRLRADAAGNLAAAQMGTRTLDSARPFDDLHMQIREIVGDDTGPGSVAESTEVELDCDYNLKFEYVIDAITSVSGYVTDAGIVKLVEKIKFSPPKAPQ